MKDGNRFYLALSSTAVKILTTHAQKMASALKMNFHNLLYDLPPHFLTKHLTFPLNIFVFIFPTMSLADPVDRETSTLSTIIFKSLLITTKREQGFPFMGESNGTDGTVHLHDEDRDIIEDVHPFL